MSIKNRLSWLFLLFLGVSLYIHAPQSSLFTKEHHELVLPPKRSERHLSITYKQVGVGGHAFTYRDDWDHVTGKRTEVWSIDSKPASRKEYELALKEAEIAQWEAEQAYEQALHQQQQEQRDQIAQIGARKLLEMTVGSIEMELKRLDDDMLRPFYRFSEHAIATEEDLSELRDELLPNARKIIRMKTEATAQEMLSLQAVLEPFIDKLKTFFYASVEQAIKQADDPRVLKKWLACVA